MENSGDFLSILLQRVHYYEGTKRGDPVFLPVLSPGNSSRLFPVSEDIRGLETGIPAMDSGCFVVPCALQLREKAVPGG